MRKFLLPLAAIAISLMACTSTKNNTKPTEPIDSKNYTIQKNLVVENGAVVSAHPLASQVGVNILKAGGNAMDAAIATHFALAVVYPNAGNLGGGGFTVAHMKDGTQLAIDYREKAPSAAHRDMYIDSAGNPRTDWSQDGHLAGGVPGTVAGIFEMYKQATLPMEQLIQPAIDLAENGFAITESEARGLNNLKEDLLKYNTVIPVFVKDTPWKAGDILVQKDLANTLKRIQKNGKAGFYEGETARLIVEEMKRGTGIISLEDLKNYTAASRTPHRFSYKGFDFIAMPMPSSGGALLHQMLKMIEDKNIASMGHLSTQAVHLMAEVERRAYADRAEFMGDNDFYPVPAAEITSDVYLKNRMKDFNPNKASLSTDIKPGVVGKKESEETTHFSVLDKWGNAVSVTTTLNNSYGSRTVIGGAGFILNDEMDDFSIKPGVPNMYGALGGEANAIAPGKRMLSSMAPTIVLKDNKPYIVIGTPGGTTIPTQVFQTLVNLLEFNLSADDAVNKPRFHHQWLPDRLDVEPGFPEKTVGDLKKMGHTIRQRGRFGRLEMIRILPNGKLEAIADSRGDDSAAGY